MTEVPIILLWKSTDWLLYDRDFRHKRVKGLIPDNFQNLVSEATQESYFIRIFSNSNFKI